MSALFLPLEPNATPRGPFVKLIDEETNVRPVRVRVRILDTSTDRLVVYPSGRVRYFGSESAADEWIRAQHREPRSFRPRNYTPPGGRAR